MRTAALLHIYYDAKGERHEIIEARDIDAELGQRTLLEKYFTETEGTEATAI